jgi:AcrR family transcriptional regulator
VSDTGRVRSVERKRSGPQDREVRARQRLLVAAREVFERDGFHAARIVDVANTAGVGIGTFYRHFESKGMLFRAVISNAFDEIYVGGSTRAADPEHPTVAIELANERFLDQYRREAPMHSLLEQLAPLDDACRELYLSGRKRAVDRIAHSIEELQAKGQANPDLDARVAAGALVAMVNNSAHIWFTLGEPYDEDVALDTLNQIWISGIGLVAPERSGDEDRRTRKAARRTPKAATRAAKATTRAPRKVTKKTTKATTTATPAAARRTATRATGGGAES